MLPSSTPEVQEAGTFLCWLTVALGANSSALSSRADARTKQALWFFCSNELKVQPCGKELKLDQTSQVKPKRCELVTRCV
jgi:hypothetical protein